MKAKFVNTSLNEFERKDNLQDEIGIGTAAKMKAEYIKDQGGSSYITSNNNYDSIDSEELFHYFVEKQDIVFLNYFISTHQGLNVDHGYFRKALFINKNQEILKIIFNRYKLKPQYTLEKFLESHYPLNESLVKFLLSNGASVDLNDSKVLINAASDNLDTFKFVSKLGGEITITNIGSIYSKLNNIWKDNRGGKNIKFLKSITSPEIFLHGRIETEYKEVANIWPDIPPKPNTLKELNKIKRNGKFYVNRVLFINFLNYLRGSIATRNVEEIISLRSNLSSYLVMKCFNLYNIHPRSSFVKFTLFKLFEIIDNVDSDQHYPRNVFGRSQGEQFGMEIVDDLTRHGILIRYKIGRKYFLKLNPNFRELNQYPLRDLYEKINDLDITNLPNDIIEL